MMEPFSVHRETRTHVSVFTQLFTPTLVQNWREKLSSNLYDGLNNYFAFSPQFVDELAPYLCC